MAVALRGVTPGAYLSSGSGTVAWPPGTVAGDLAVVALSEDANGSPDSEPTPDGWILRQATTSNTVWYKRLTAADIAAPLKVKAYAVMLQTFEGAGKLGNATTTNGVTLTTAGAGLFGYCRSQYASDAPSITPSGGKLHADITNPSARNRRHTTWFVAYSTTGYKSLSTNANYISCFEIVPLAGPKAPTLNTPAAGAQINLSVANTFSWLHNSSQKVRQDEFKLRLRQVGTSTWYYLTVAGTLSTTDLSIATINTSAVLNAGQLTTTLTYEWQVATNDSNSWSPYSTARQFTAAVPPSVSSITVTSTPGGLNPTVSWTATTGLGSRIAWRVYIKDATTGATVWDSGNRSGSGLTVTAPADAPWVNGQTLRAYVQVRQTGGLWSPLTAAGSTFTVSWTAPTPPSTVLATNQNDRPLRVTVTGINTGYSRVEVQQSTDSQVTWKPLHSGPATTSILTIDLPKAVYGVPARFRSRQADIIDGQLKWSEWTVSAADVASTDTACYLLDLDSSEYIQVRVRQDDPQTLVEAFSVTYGINATEAVVHRTPTAGLTGRTVFGGKTKAERTALVAFLNRNAAFTIRWSPELETGQVSTGVIADPNHPGLVLMPGWLTPDPDHPGLVLLPAGFAPDPDHPGLYLDEAYIPDPDHPGLYLLRSTPGRVMVDAGTINVQRISPLTQERLAQYVVALRDLPVEWVEA